MRVPFLLLLIQWLASVSAQQSCSSFFEFAVDNCTACPTLDHTRGDIEVAVCEERAANTSYACVCRQADHSVTYTFFYFPRVDGSGTRCANSWETAPHLYTALSVVSGSVLLYPMTHLFYIVILSGICSCKRRRCTKMKIASLLLGIFSLCTFVHLVIRVTSQGKNVGTSGADYYARAQNSMEIIFWCEFNLLDMALGLYCTSISDTLHPGEETKCRRRCINLPFWILLSTQALCTIIMIAVLCASGDLSEITNGYIALFAQSVRFLMMAYISIFMILAHRAMHQIVRKHSESPTKPPLIVKMDELCGAICRYYYPFVIFTVAFFIFSYIAYYVCLPYMSPDNFWIISPMTYLWHGGIGTLLACFLEGKRVPTFPTCLCRRRGQSKPTIRKLTGLQLTSTLGNALALLTKHGLDNQRRQDSPVEAAMESLLSTSPLMVAAAPDMDLMSCVEHFLDRCVDDNGEIAKRFAQMPVGRLLRAGCTQHTVGPDDIPKLRGKAERCLQWAQDPDRPPIEDTTVDEAAAIMLYTQHSCLYPLLNSTLRDHPHPEHLKAFLPYLKLFLKGLNKLPLVREQVYRGMSGDLHEEYNQLQGRAFRWWAFSSTTIRESLAETFLGDGDRTLFSIDAIGVDISQFSAYQNESEVLLLPGTCLVVEPGVMVEPNYWRFEASVWQAAHQQQLQQYDEGKPENGESGIPDSVINDRDDSGLSISRFQNTDLPHPGWEEIVLTEDYQSPTPHTKSRVHLGTK